jgi:hypothetical protein
VSARLPTVIQLNISPTSGEARRGGMSGNLFALTNSIEPIMKAAAYPPALLMQPPERAASPGGGPRA